MKKQKKQEGSILILTLLALVGALSISVAMVSISVVERKMTTKSKKSVTAFQSANSGIEWALKKINDATVSGGKVQKISDVFTMGSDGKISCPSGFFDSSSNTNCEIYLLRGTNQNRQIIKNPNITLDKVIAVRATGIYGQSAEQKVGRFLEAYAMPNCPTNYERVADFCIATEVVSGQSWNSAINFCADGGKRLCTTAELLAAKRIDSSSLILSDSIGNSDEWTADVADSFGNRFYIDSSGDVQTDSASSNKEYRCCVNR